MERRLAAILAADVVAYNLPIVIELAVSLTCERRTPEMHTDG